MILDSILNVVYIFIDELFIILRLYTLLWNVDGKKIN